MFNSILIIVIGVTVAAILVYVLKIVFEILVLGGLYAVFAFQAWREKKKQKKKQKKRRAQKRTLRNR